MIGELLARWGHPGRCDDDPARPPEGNEGRGPRVRYNYSPQPSTLKDCLLAVTELTQVDDLECRVRAYEIAEQLKHRVTLPAGTWCAVFYYRDGWREGPSVCTACFDEAEARRAAAEHQRFWDERDSRPGRPHSNYRFEAEQVDGVAPHLLFQRGVDYYEYDKQVHVR